MEQGIPRPSPVWGFIYSGYARLAIIVVPVLGILALLMPVLMTNADEMARGYHGEFTDQVNKIIEKITKSGGTTIDELIVIPITPVLSIADTVQNRKINRHQNKYIITLCDGI